VSTSQATAWHGCTTTSTPMRWMRCWQNSKGLPPFFTLTPPHYMSMNIRKYRKAVDAIMDQYGFVFFDDSNHLKYKHPSLGIVQTCSKTPSDNYALAQIKRQCRRSVAALS
jgi:hypothetical protein